MPFTETPIEDLLIFEPRIFEDSRGYFFENYNENVFKEKNIETRFVQDNQSLSTYGTIRGLHFQTGKYEQAKLVRVTQGKVLDVAVDLRAGSSTFGKWFSIILSAENNKQLYLPRGFAHGFSVLSETAIFQYKCDHFYNKESEAGILFNDPELNIDWQLPIASAITSEKDQTLETFTEFKEKL